MEKTNETLIGIVPIYKPKGITSHDVVSVLRHLTHIKKIGHAGTLDPLASGVLVVGIGREATRQMASVVAKEKEYLTTITLGVVSTTDDEEGEKTLYEVTEKPTQDMITTTLLGFTGTIMQIPPIFSAVKINGRTAYSLARKHKEIILEPRQVLIKDIQLISYTWPYVCLKVTTGPGVYIRALARDIGQKLKAGAYMSALERVRVGEYNLDQAVRLPELATLAQQRMQKRSNN